MKRFLIPAALALAACLGACGVYNTDTYQAQQAALYGDRAATITCYGYSTVLFDGRSTGKVLYDEGGRLSFVDAATGQYTSVEGECRVVHDAGAPTVAASRAPR